MVFHQNILALTLPIDLNDTVSEQVATSGHLQLMNKIFIREFHISYQLEELNHNVFRRFPFCESLMVDKIIAFNTKLIEIGGEIISSRRLEKRSPVVFLAYRCTECGCNGIYLGQGIQTMMICREI
ncbi:unnamed protein product [Prunus brigantina]